MPESNRTLVINTTPLIALTVATDGLEVLRLLYDRVIVPHEVEQEMLAAGRKAPGVVAFEDCRWLERLPTPRNIPTFLQNTLDRGEASVIQAAIQFGLPHPAEGGAPAGRLKVANNEPRHSAPFRAIPRYSAISPLGGFVLGAKPLNFTPAKNSPKSCPQPTT